MGVYEFLKQNNMLAESIDAEEIEKKYLNDMEGGGSLLMVNSYQRVSDAEIPNTKLLAIDAGGTNLRFAEFENGKMISEVKMPMFGVEKEITADEFFDLMAAEIDKYNADKVGLCYSYPTIIQENRDAISGYLSKEVKITGIEGKYLGAEINKRLKKKRVFSILNDTVASQLGVKADAGIILGTGFNICYTDKKLGTIVNTESGQFTGVPFGRCDNMLNERLHSNITNTEKMISGAYLGDLIWITASEYFQKDIPQFKLAAVSEFFIGEGPLYEFFSTEEKKEFRELVSYLLERAAKIVAIFVKCLLKDYDTANIALEGSTVYKLPGYYDAVKDQIDKIPGLKVKLLDARGTIQLGSVRSLL